MLRTLHARRARRARVPHALTSFVYPTPFTGVVQSDEAVYCLYVNNALTNTSPSYLPPLSLLPLPSLSLSSLSAAHTVHARFRAPPSDVLSLCVPAQGMLPPRGPSFLPPSRGSTRSHPPTLSLPPLHPPVT